VTVCLGGTGEVVRVNGFGVLSARVEVGKRPVQALAVNDWANSGLPTVVVNTYSDSLSIVDLDEGRLLHEISLGPQRTLKPAERGEALFHDSRLSHDGWLSCQSCHTDGHTNGLLADTFGDGDWGAPKRVLPLGGVAFTDRWAWGGQMQELTDQVRKSLLTTMLSDSVDDANVNDLVAYLQTLLPPPALAPEPANPAERSQVARGRTIFLDQGCQHCHVPPLTYTSSDSYDVGLEDENGRKKFNPPSLRGVGHGKSFLHDNRAKSLESVFRDHAHPSRADWTDGDLGDLVRFLKSL